MSVKATSCGPVAIGGVGGSGTRLVARVLEKSGFFIGSDLNAAKDNLWFTLLFKHADAPACAEESFENAMRIFLKAMRGGEPLSSGESELLFELAARERPLHESEWLKLRAESLMERCGKIEPSTLQWGWKEPNTHVLLDRLNRSIPGLRYIHVCRNGLDMAFSSNQNQVRLWGKLFLGEDVSSVTPEISLRFWRSVHTRVLQAGKEMGPRFLMVNYDRLCASPERELPRMLHFLRVAAPLAQLTAIRREVQPPSSIGRFRQWSRECFADDDVAYVESLGFEVE